MKPRLIRYLCCPSCASDLSLDASDSRGGEIMEGALACSGCGARYAIRGGIPRMLPDRRSAEEDRTLRIFEYEWRKFPAHYAVFKTQFLDWIYPLTADFIRGKTVLDAGCGMGRHMAQCAEMGAREIIGIDASGAADVAYANVGRHPAAHVVQADIYRLPFRPVFDYAYSIGVLHHLPRPRDGFLSLVRLLASGGTISIWVYGRENSYFAAEILSPLRRRLISKLPLGMVLGIAFLGNLALFPCLRLYRLLHSLSPGIAGRLPYAAYFLNLSEFNFRFNWANVFDHISPPIAFYLTRGEVESWFADAGCTDVVITHRNNNSWRGCGRRPA